MMKRILFTGGGGAGNEALFRLLGDPYEVHFADADRQAIDCSVPEERRHEIPFANDPSFTDELCALMERLQIELLVPGVDEELSLVAGLVDAGRVQALLPPKPFVDRHLDKFSSMQQLGAFAPKTVMASEAAAIGFPCIAKPRSGRGSRGVSVIKSQEQLAAYLTFYEVKPETVIAQELGTGQEFTVLMAANCAGTLRAVVPVKVGIKRGITLRAETCRDAAVEEVCCKIHEATPVAGCYNIQLIRQEDGRVLVFEINPRISTTFCLGIAAGVNPIEIFLQGSGEASLLPFIENLQLHRFWTNHFSTD